MRPSNSAESSGATRFCHACGASIGIEDAFCRDCGVGQRLPAGPEQPHSDVVTAPQAVGVRDPSAIARRHKIWMTCFGAFYLGSCLARPLAGTLVAANQSSPASQETSMADLLTLLVGLALLAAFLASGARLLLAMGYNRWAVAGVVAGLTIPVLHLVPVIIIDGRVRRFLREAGFQLGFLGASGRHPGD